jgi:ethanolamine utilization protein EutN
VLVGKVIGEVWATRRAPALPEVRLLCVAPVAVGEEAVSSETVVIAADEIGAGVGEHVVVAYGHAARNALGRGEEIAIEAAVVGIVDEAAATTDGVEIPGGER